MSRRLSYELVAVTALATLFTIAIRVAEATRGPDDPGTMPPLGEGWALKPADHPVSPERKAIRIVYQPLIGTR